MKYNYDEIIVGDSIYFEIQGMSNYDLYWEVVEMPGNNKVKVKINEMGVDDMRHIDVNALFSFPRCR